MTLIETILALLVLAAVTSAVILLLTQIMALTTSARLRNTATAMAEQNLEKIRSFYQVNFWMNLANKGSSGGTCYIDTAGILNLDTGATCVTDCSSLGSNGFRQNVKLTTDSGLSRVQVDSSVWWQDKGACQHLTSTTYYFNY